MTLCRTLHGDALEQLRALPDESVQVCVTSPPYYGLRQYLKPGHPDYFKQIGLESTFDCLGWARAPRCGMCYICRLTEVFTEVRRVLSTDGTLWLNMGDSYANPDKGGYQDERTGDDSLQRNNLAADFIGAPNRHPQGWLKPKDLMLAPERLALSLQASGWYLRSRIIWHKTSTMPESVRDRPTKSHEHIWLLSKAKRYYYDSSAAMEPVTQSTIDRVTQSTWEQQHGSDRANGGAKSNGTMKAVVKRSGNKERKPASARGVPVDDNCSTNGAVAGSIPWEGSMRNWRDVWPIGPEPFTDFGYDFASADYVDAHGIPRKRSADCLVHGPNAQLQRGSPAAASCDAQADPSRNCSTRNDACRGTMLQPVADSTSRCTRSPASGSPCDAGEGSILSSNTADGSDVSAEGISTRSQHTPSESSPSSPDYAPPQGCLTATPRSTESHKTGRAQSSERPTSSAETSCGIEHIEEQRELFVLGEHNVASKSEASLCSQREPESDR